MSSKRKLSTKQRRVELEYDMLLEQAEVTQEALVQYLCGEPDSDLIGDNNVTSYTEKMLSELPDEMAGVVAAIRKARAVRLAKL